ncbi:MAG: hypothetical protein ACNA8W_16020 [Bradymonadaceae bacterium]
MIAGHHGDTRSESILDERSAWLLLAIYATLNTLGLRPPEDHGRRFEENLVRAMVSNHLAGVPRELR